MIYGIEFTDVAELEMQNALIWLMGRSPEGAGRWQEGLERAVATLAEFPRRCPSAPEADVVGTEVRQLLYGTYRILFTIVDSDGDGETDTVRILHERHTAQATRRTERREDQ